MGKRGSEVESGGGKPEMASGRRQHFPLLSALIEQQSQKPARICTKQ